MPLPLPPWLDGALTPWGWLSAAAVLAALEILLPGAWMMWLAAAALMTALVTVLLGLSWPWQMGAFAVFAVLSVLASRRYAKEPIASKDPALNRAGLRMVGRVAVVVDPIVHGAGRVRLGDTTWSARGPDAGAGTRVRIVTVDGSVLRVLPAQDEGAGAAALSPPPEPKPQQ
jgi:membrane protein implicated in regulation of membrane protease activity